MSSGITARMCRRVGARVCESRSIGPQVAGRRGTMRALHAMALLPCLLLAGCSEETVDPDPGAEDPGMELPADEFDTPAAMPPADDGYLPKALTATRFGVFYQVTHDVLDLYQDADRGLPVVANHAWLITQSHATAYASRALGD